MDAPKQEDKKKSSPPIIEGKLVYTSPSAMQLFATCARKWIFKYKLNLPDDPPGPGQERGTLGHKRIEDFLLRDMSLDPYPLEKLGLDRGLIPTPGAGLIIEGKLGKYVKGQGVPLTGKIDLADSRDWARLGVLRVKDWKFKKSIKKYGAKKEDLIDPKDVDTGMQMIPYAEWARQAILAGEFGPTESADPRVELFHVTFQTDPLKPDVAQVANVLTLQRIGELWEIESQQIGAMAEAAAKGSPFDVPGNEKACWKYGKRCPYLDQCSNPMQRLAARFTKTDSQKTGDKKMGMFAQFKNGNAAPAAIQPPPPAAPPAQQIAEAPKRRIVIEDAPADSVLAKNAIQGKAYLANGTKSMFLCSTSGKYSFLPVAGGAPILLDPDSSVMPISLESAPEAPAAPVAPPEPVAVVAEPRPTTEISSASDTGTAPAAATTATVPEVDKPKRGRPKKSEATAQAPQALITPSGNPSQGPEKAEEAGTSSALNGNVQLYFGCAPVGVKTDTLNAYVEALDLAIREQFKLELIDLRCATDSIFGFGKWKAYIGKGAIMNPPPAGHYVVTEGDERVQAVAEALAGMLPAGSVVMGSRR